MAKRTERIEFRVTPEEKQALTTAAAAAGLTLTGYMIYRLAEVTGEMLGDAIVKSRNKGKK